MSLDGFRRINWEMMTGWSIIMEDEVMSVRGGGGVVGRREAKKLYARQHPDDKYLSTYRLGRYIGT